MRCQIPVPAPTIGIMPAFLNELCAACDAAATPASKLKKQEVLANYFRSLDEPDLRLAVRFVRGRAFSSTDERVLSVGGAIVSDVILSILNLDPQEFWRLVVKNGEGGEALAQVWPARGVGWARGEPASMR